MDENTQAATDAHRVQAAKVTAGISVGPVYQLVLDTFDKQGLAGSVLDFGAGTGTLALALSEKESVTKVVAADLVAYSEVSAPKVEWRFGDLNNPLPDRDGSFDAVAAIEVIEHLENPRSVVRECFRLLRPGGTLLLSTPNSESWRSVISFLGRGHFAHFTGPSYPAHITALLRLDMERICREAGFETVRFLFTDYGMVPKLTFRTWQQVSFGLLKGVRYSDNVLCIAQKPMVHETAPS